MVHKQNNPSRFHLFVGTCLLYYLRNGELTGVDIAFKALAAVSLALTFYFIGPWLERHRPEDWLSGKKRSEGGG